MLSLPLLHQQSHSQPTSESMEISNRDLGTPCTQLFPRGTFLPCCRQAALHRGHRISGMRSSITALCQHRHSMAFLLRLADGSGVQMGPFPKDSAACRTDTSQGEQRAEGYSEEREPRAVRAALGLEDSPRRVHRRQEQRRPLRGGPRLLPHGLYPCRRHCSRQQLTA